MEKKKKERTERKRERGEEVIDRKKTTTRKKKMIEKEGRKEGVLSMCVLRRVFVEELTMKRKKLLELQKVERERAREAPGDAEPKQITDEPSRGERHLREVRRRRRRRSSFSSTFSLEREKQVERDPVPLLFSCRVGEKERKKELEGFIPSVHQIMDFRWR